MKFNVADNELLMELRKKWKHNPQFSLSGPGCVGDYAEHPRIRLQIHVQPKQSGKSTGPL